MRNKQTKRTKQQFINDLQCGLPRKKKIFIFLFSKKKLFFVSNPAEAIRAIAGCDAWRGFV
jgi:hypothetical protein